MSLRRIIKMFDKGNVCVTGLLGRGKDMLLANVVCRRKLPYVSNVVYDVDLHHEFDPEDFTCGRNTYKNFINKSLNYYQFPFADGTDLYLSDAGVYFPAQYCNELNRDYGYFATFMALARQVGECSVHFNVQNLNRAWDKIREMADIYISCRWCKVFFKKIVVQLVWTYDKYQSCVDRVPPFSIPMPWFNPERLQHWRIAKQNYDCSYGKVTPYLLIYINKSNYNTRIFKEVLLNGKRQKA